MKIPFGEFAPDIAKVDSSVATVAKNVVPVGDKYEALNSVGGVIIDQVPDTAIPEASWYKENHPLSSNKKVVVARNSLGSEAYIYINGIDVTNVSGLTRWTNASIGINKYDYDFIEWDDAILIYGNIEVPQKLLSGSFGVSFDKSTDIANSPRAFTAAKIREFVVLGCIYESATEYLTRVRWSAFDDYESWTVGTNQSDFQDLPSGGRIVKVVGGAEEGYILQQYQVVRMTYVGTPSIFQFDVIEGARGCASHRSVVEVGSDVYYLSNEGFAVLRGGSTTELIGKNKIDNYFFEVVDGDVNNYGREDVVGCYDQMSGCIYWGFDGENGVYQFLIYNITTGRWATAELGDVYAPGNYQRFPAGRFTNAGKSNLSFYVLEESEFSPGTFYYVHKMLLGDPLVATIETGEFSQDDALTKITEIRPLIDGTATVTTETRNLLSDSVTSTGPTSTDSSGKANVRTNARYTRIQCTTSGDFTEATGVEVKLKKGGKR